MWPNAKYVQAPKLPWGYSYWGCEPRHVCWELNSSSLQKGYKLLTAEPSCQPNFCFFTLSLFVILLIYSKKTNATGTFPMQAVCDTVLFMAQDDESKQGMVYLLLPPALGRQETEARQVDL